ncbi:MAG: tRNA pseudouridine(38-40) synthase TruA [Butyrivibrio sp.]|jgi:tRNA pseudouridine38-40 synthase|uniref:tRNA pseudouridine(38-40) synthase TruA n=1 Tax=Butyrivibrio sp. TaxID=28121 RepID=UPI001EB7B204|nr:tRNA pseudouridine(38-40) synthase TruA [Butyrivibrio sp.]MBE5842346.1 tRNA pseudouridine(38-40) synthase TruA [Butyrivibrio sp.]
MKRNYKLQISYDGTRFYGWERQPNKDMTIQGKIESVLTKMTGATEDDPVNLNASGRTDAGVHARGQVASVVLNTDMSEEEIQSYMNKYLPEDISINEVRACSERFHARYNALGKTYRYTCWYGSSKPVFDRKYVLVLEEKPDVDKMREAALQLIGTHDFKSFCGNKKMKKSTVRCVDAINIEESGNYIRFYFHGNGFLQNMVRILTGTLLEVGYGNIPVSDIKDILEACDRQKAGPTAPPEGLCLMKVDY